MEVNEKCRIEKLIEEKQKIERQNLAKKHVKEEQQLDVKFENLQNNLIIQMKKDLQLLKKQVTLHELDIKQIQNILTKFNYSKAMNEGEARRNKERSHQQNDIISNTKKSLNLLENAIERERPQTAVPQQKKEKQTVPTESTTKNIFTKQRPQSAAYTIYLSRKHGNEETSSSFLGNSPSKNEKQHTVQQLRAVSMSKNISQFYLRSKYGQNMPVNFIPIQQKQNHENKKELIEKYLKNKKPEKNENLQNLTEFYNEKLQEINIKNELLDEKSQNTRIKSFLDQKMNLTKKSKK